MQKEGGRCVNKQTTTVGHRQGWGRRQRQVAKGLRGRWMRRGREVTLSNMTEKGCIPFNFSVLKRKKSLIQWSQLQVWPTWCYNLIGVVHVLLVSPLFQLLHTRSRADVWCCRPPMRSHTRWTSDPEGYASCYTHSPSFKLSDFTFS